MRVFEFKQAGDILFDGEHGYLPYEPVIMDIDEPIPREGDDVIQTVVVPDDAHAAGDPGMNVGGGNGGVGSVPPVGDEVVDGETDKIDGRATSVTP